MKYPVALAAILSTALATAASFPQRVHHLTKGDVITIPATTPHQWKDTSKTGSVGYFAVNLESN